MGNAIVLCIKRKKCNQGCQKNEKSYSQNISEYGASTFRCKGPSSIYSSSTSSCNSSMPALPNKNKIKKISRKMSGKEHRDSYTRPRLSSGSRKCQSGSDTEYSEGSKMNNKLQKSHDAQQSEFRGKIKYFKHTQLEVQWVYSGHLVHLQWGTVDALHAIYSGHCSYTVARYSVHTVVTYSAHTVDTLYVHCIRTVATL